MPARGTCSGRHTVRACMRTVLAGLADKVGACLRVKLLRRSCTGGSRRFWNCWALEALGTAAALIADDEGAARRVGRPLVDDGRRSREEEHAVGGERAVPNMRLHLRTGGVRPRAARDPARLGLPGLWKWQRVLR